MIFIGLAEDRSIAEQKKMALTCAVGVCFYFAAWFHTFLSFLAIQIITRIMGLILTAIAFSMLGVGLLQMFPGLA